MRSGACSLKSDRVPDPMNLDAARQDEITIKRIRCHVTAAIHQARTLQTMPVYALMLEKWLGAAAAALKPDSEIPPEEPEADLTDETDEED